MLVERGLAKDVKHAQALILAGKVFSDEQRVEKPGTRVSIDIPIEVRGEDHPWVSRGGVKLNHALDHFQIDIEGVGAIDVGSSTGGFTDVLLSRGVAHVYAVDVGYGQLHWKLRQDNRVSVLERQNARYLTRDQIQNPVGAVVCDASFTRLESVMSVPMEFVASGGYLVALIKPQFEVEKNEVGRGGIVRDPALHRDVCARIENWLTGVRGWTVLGVEESPITGLGGNTEFFIAARLDD
ncbi:MAG: TlyA family RNA methyltransferase [Pseudomonadota bacterium]|nr:TlyA family RNA methyltransferase [Pseudomonadota bacterium]